MMLFVDANLSYEWAVIFFLTRSIIDLSTLLGLGSGSNPFRGGRNDKWLLIYENINRYYDRSSYDLDANKGASDVSQ